MAFSCGVSSALSALRRKTTSRIFAMPNFINLPPFTEDGDVHGRHDTRRHASLPRYLHDWIGESGYY